MNTLYNKTGVPTVAGESRPFKEIMMETPSDQPANLPTNRTETEKGTRRDKNCTGNMKERERKQKGTETGIVAGRDVNKKKGEREREVLEIRREEDWEGEWEGSSHPNILAFPNPCPSRPFLKLKFQL